MYMHMCIYVCTNICINTYFQFILQASQNNLVEIFSDEGLLQEYGEEIRDKFHPYNAGNILFELAPNILRELPDSTRESILYVKLNDGYKYIHTCMNIYIYIYICIYVYRYIYMYICTHVYYTRDYLVREDS